MLYGVRRENGRKADALFCQRREMKLVSAETLVVCCVLKSGSSVAEAHRSAVAAAPGASADR